MLCFLISCAGSWRLIQGRWGKIFSFPFPMQGGFFYLKALRCIEHGIRSYLEAGAGDRKYAEDYKIIFVQTSKIFLLFTVHDQAVLLSNVSGGKFMSTHLCSSLLSGDLFDP